MSSLKKKVKDNFFTWNFWKNFTNNVFFCTASMKIINLKKLKNGKNKLSGTQKKKEEKIVLTVKDWIWDSVCVGMHDVSFKRLDSRANSERHGTCIFPPIFFRRCKRFYRLIEYGGVGRSFGSNRNSIGESSTRCWLSDEELRLLIECESTTFMDQ